jgi:anti-sigma-K factor RskA
MTEQLEEQSALYTFGLLEGDEAIGFERRLESDAELRSEVDQFDAVAAQLAHRARARPLPGELRAKVLDRIGSGTVRAFPRARQWIPWAAAACLALTSAYLVAERGRLRHRISHLEKRDLLAQVRIAALTSQLQNASDAHATVVWDGRRQRGILKVSRLPRNAADRDYQLWLVDPRYKDPVNGGVFHLANEEGISLFFHPAEPVRDAKEFAISLERKGGVAKAEGPIVLMGK